jgi:hypothetical protein
MNHLCSTHALSEMPLGPSFDQEHQRVREGHFSSDPHAQIPVQGLRFRISCAGSPRESAGTLNSGPAASRQYVSEDKPVAFDDFSGVNRNPA